MFGQDMRACPTCGGYHLQYQTPIKMEDPITDSDDAKTMVKKWAKSYMKDERLEGPVFIMCFECGHKGPSVDCAGRSRDDVGQDKNLADTIKSLWNNQK